MLYTFPKDGIPTVIGVWAVTLLNIELFLVDNGINCYSIGKHTQGLNIPLDGFARMF